MTTSNADLSSKLGAPPKKSIFERQKAEAEAKRLREKAETAAVLEDFVKSFDDDGEEPVFPSKRGNFGGAGSTNHGHSATPGKRHFTSSGLKSGPGSLGPSPSLPKSGPGSLGAVPSLGKKRIYDDYSGARDRAHDRERDRKDRMFSYGDDRDKDRRRDSDALAADDEDARDADELKAAAKPTLHLSSLPPGTSAAVIRGLFTPSPLTIENVKVLPTVPGPTSDRSSASAIVTLAAETPATDIDTMVSHLQNKYLGFGFNLSISRHLSSAALIGASSLSNSTPSANLNNLPFGAKPIQQRTSLSRAPPPGVGQGRFPPPASYTSSTPYSQRPNQLPPTQVTVQAPSDLKQIRLIHKTLEALLTYGPEFEALLMSRPEIQRDEQWAWLWNSRSTSGVYYRWRLWEIITNAKGRKRRQPANYSMRPPGDTLFEGQSVWIPPEEELKFEYTTRLENFISDDDYNSSDEEDAEESGGLARRYQDHQKLGANVSDPVSNVDGVGYLNPLAKTKLVHLLSRLPESNAKLRRGDVARVTGFAIEHAGAGADEVAALVTLNVIKPFCHGVSKAGKAPDSDDEDLHSDDPDDSKPGVDESEKDKDKSTTKDTTPASLVGLFIISDILSSSASAGVRHAWRYRSLFETQLRLQSVFPTLGRAPRELNWGKLKAEKWRRSVQNVLGLWEGWCVFPIQSHESFVEGFLHPPLTQKEERALKEKEEKEGKAEKGDARRDKGASRWRSVDDQQGQNADSKVDESGLDGVSVSKPPPDKDADGDVEMDMDGTPMVDEDYDEDFTDTNLDGVPMADSSDDDQDQDQDQDKGETEAEPGEQENKAVSGPTPASKADPNSAEDSLEPAPPENLTTTSAAADAAASVAHGRRARPRAADFDDMFE